MIQKSEKVEIFPEQNVINIASMTSRLLQDDVINKNYGVEKNKHQK